MQATVPRMPSSTGMDSGKAGDGARPLRQQSAGMSIAGLGNRSAPPRRPGGMLGRDQPEVGADTGTSEPVPAADFHSQTESGQSGNSPHAGQALDQAVYSLSKAILVMAV